MLTGKVKMRYITMNDGVRIAVYDLNPKGRKTIVFIHGWPLDHRIFEYQTNILPKLGYRVVSIDLRGFGASDTAAFDYSYDRLAKDIHQVVVSMNLNHFVLAGFSVGGAIALRYMKKCKGHGVSKLALLAAAAPKFTQGEGYPFGMSAEAVNTLIAQTYVNRPQMVADFGQLFFGSNPTAELREWFKGLGFDASGNGTIGVLESLRDEDVSHDMSCVHVPTAIFHGKLDQACPFAFAQLMHHGIKGSLLYAFENSGHAIFYDELAVFNQTFFDWLR